MDDRLTTDDLPCPACHAPPGCLSVQWRLYAKPIGSWSLAGAQPKTVAVERPVLVCSACDLEVVGERE